MRGLSSFLPFNLLILAVNMLVIAVIVFALLALFKSNIYNRLSTRITIIIIISGLVAIVLALVFNEVTRNTLSPIWLRQLQIALIVIGGPVILGLLAARFVQRPLRQFNNAMASLEQSNYQVHLQPAGIREFDEVFTKFNNLIQRLKQEEKLRKDLVSDTSHELNTPLAAMIGQLTAIQEGKHPITEERIDSLKEQAERLAELVQQLDAYTKARTPHPDSPEEVPVKLLCEQLATQFSVELKQKGIRVVQDIPDDLTISANRDALRRILTNLIQNTIRHSRATEITISASATHLSFSDNGKGVPSESLPYLFERFYRVDKSRDRKTGGLGLGLAIVSELAEQQGWHVHAEHGQPGISFVLTWS